jgi:hypothetical protein
MADSASGPQNNTSLCQIETAQDGGRMRRPGSFYVLARILWNLQHRGVRHTLHATFGPRITAFRERFESHQRTVRTPICGEEILDLRPGEMVEVKSLHEILETLDDKGRNHGLVFTPEMRQHCLKQYRVFKRLELMFDEYHKSQRRVKNTVLLESVVCGGAGIGCDRSCFLYWREVWLRRV